MTATATYTDGDGISYFVYEDAHGNPRACSHYPGEDPHPLGWSDTACVLRWAIEDLARERLINRGNGESAAWANVHRLVEQERTRAEKAEAALAQLHSWQLERVEGIVRCPVCTEHHVHPAQAAVDRVRALCDVADRMHGEVKTRAVRAVLDGGAS